MLRHFVIKAVTFDAYGTLLRLERPFELMGEALSKRGFTIPQETIIKAFSEEMAYYKAHHMEGRDMRSLSDLRKRCALLLFDRFSSLGYSCPLDVEEMVAVLMESIRFSIFPDVIPTLKGCSSMGIKTAIVSNWDCSLPDTVKAVFSVNSFESVLVSAIEGVDKSGPEIFVRAAQALAEDPSAILHVGDDPVHDLESPIKAGFQALLIEREGAFYPERGAWIASLEDIPVIGTRTDRHNKRQ
jgi:FMN phosphatase YigB (HAD superfamily)